MAAAMGAIDCLTFTGGVGENSPEIRDGAARGLEFLGIQLDAQRNTSGPSDREHQRAREPCRHVGRRRARGHPDSPRGQAGTGSGPAPRLVSRSRRFQPVRDALARRDNAGSARAWEVTSPAPIDEGPLRLVDRPLPEPGPGQVLVRVSVCGVCRTDLHVTEGDLPVHRPNVVPGHEIVGVVHRLGPGTMRFSVGDRIGIAWLASTCGACRFCRRGDENLCTAATFTGWDHDGGYAEAALVDERYAYLLPPGLADELAAPLLCRGDHRLPGPATL